jgi:hypothetical protein|tara:strand:- start:340 stop:522 length:183 start_codon:yes stop_codon:yes gene_type:complete
MTSKKPKWDGRSRPSTDLYKKNFNKIFGVKTPYEELQEELIKGDKRFGAMKRKRNNDKKE